jgi:hypothetical protein
MATKGRSGVGSHKEPHLTGNNAIYLWSFVGVNVAIFLSLLASRHFDRSSIADSWTVVSATNGIIAAIIPLATIIFAGLLNDVTKARLVFWRWCHPLPGSRVFSELIQTDSRIDPAAVKKSIGKFPRAPQDQNVTWYRLYKKHKMTRSVWESHKRYLLTRDMSTVAAISALMFSAGIAMTGVDRQTLLIYSALLATQYTLIARAAHNYGNRFVLNVVCEESSVQSLA